VPAVRLGINKGQTMAILRLTRSQVLIAATSALLLVAGISTAVAESNHRDDDNDHYEPGEPSPTLAEWQAQGEFEGFGSDAATAAGDEAQSHPLITMKTIPGSAFHLDREGSNFTADGSSTTGCLSFSSNTTLRKHVELPHNTRVTAMFVYGRNSADETPMSVELDEISYNNTSTPDREEIVTVTASGDNNRNLWAEVVSGGGHTMDAMDSYILTFRAGDGGQLCGVTLWYDAQVGDDGYVFHPVEPCAAFDTRESQGGQGKLDPDTNYTFRTRNSLTDQGGAEDSCGVPSSAQAVQMNLVAIDGEGTGNLRVWPGGGDLPQGGVVNFSEGVPNSNALSVGVSAGSNSNVQVRANGFPVHVRGVILGYYERMHPSQIN
jgi:hypothetical protein